MSELFIEDYIKKITYLEKNIGGKVSYTLLAPALLKAYDIISIQNSAKAIAEFLNMKDYLFVVAFSKQKENVGGHIELKYSGKEVFIEISDSAMKFPEAIIATLAHEITHKYMQMNNLAYGTNDYENEVFTDITAIFLGFGKLLLNGCDNQTVKFENEKTITETYKTGYLNRNQIAFVYLLICFMRNIPASKYEQGLFPGTVGLLSQYKHEYSYYFDESLHKETRNELFKEMSISVRGTQGILFEIDKNITFVKNASLKIVEEFLTNKHRKIRNFIAQTIIMEDEQEYDPCLNYLKTLELKQVIKSIVSKMDGYSMEAVKYKESMTKLKCYIEKVGEPFITPDANIYRIVVCRNDGTKIRIPKDKLYVTVKCPKCGYKFVADSTDKLNIVEHKKNRAKKKTAIFKKFSSLFRRRQ